MKIVRRPGGVKNVRRGEGVAPKTETGDQANLSVGLGPPLKRGWNGRKKPASLAGSPHFRNDWRPETEPRMKENLARNSARCILGMGMRV